MAASPLYGFGIYKSPDNAVDVEAIVIGANNAIFTQGDPVVILNGFATTAGSNLAILPGPGVSTPILGIAAKTVTMSSTNQTVAQVRVPVITPDMQYTFLAGADGELSLTTHPGLFFSISTNATISGQFFGVAATSATALFATSTPCLCVAVDPLMEGTTGLGGGSRKGLFRFVRSVNNPVSSSPGN